MASMPQLDPIIQEYDETLNSSLEDLPNYDKVEEESPSKYSREEINKAWVNLNLMGYALDTEEEVVELLKKKEDILALNPTFNVLGRWVHTLRQTNPERVIESLPSILSSKKEICVTDSNQKPFWDFSEYRDTAIVLEGVCKVLWNADVYSSYDGPTLIRSIHDPLDHVNVMTEGWLSPSEQKFIGIRIKNNPTKKIQQYMQAGIPIDNYEQIEKQIIDIQFYTDEETKQYQECPINESSPEHLYEIKEEGSVFSNDMTYQEFYNKQLMSSNVEEIRAALANGANPNSYKALYKASINGRIEAVKLLLEYGADPNSQGALQEASCKGHTEIVKLLLEKGANPNSQDALFYAASYGNTEAVKLLVEYGADPSSQRALYWSSGNGHTETVKLLLEAETLPDEGSLDIATRSGHIEIVKLLLEYALKYGINLDIRNALELAYRYGHTYIVNLLEEVQKMRSDAIDSLINDEYVEEL
jgi:hypothetical protein